MALTCVISLAGVQHRANKLFGKMTKFLNRFHLVEVCQDESNLSSTGIIIVLAIMRSLKKDGKTVDTTINRCW
jgi:hypothetical protein